MTGRVPTFDGLEVVARLVPRGARVLDLGCGDGSLLELLRDERSCDVRGIEIDHARAAHAVSRGIPVMCVDLDEGLGMYADGSFDVVVLSQTLQVVGRPAQLVSELLRVGGTGVVTFPNFAHWRVRAYLCLKGRMPVSEEIPYAWHETPNIHHTTLPDFEDLVRTLGGRVTSAVGIRSHGGAVTRALGLRAESIVATIQAVSSHAAR